MAQANRVQDAAVFLGLILAVCALAVSRGAKHGPKGPVGSAGKLPGAPKDAPARAALQSGRGREADKPSEIPAKGWK